MNLNNVELAVGKQYGKLQWCDHCDDTTDHFQGQCVLHNGIKRILETMKVTCRECKKETSVDESTGLIGRSKFCWDCVKKHAKGRSRTLRSVMINMYSRMRVRCLGLVPKKNKLYKGLPLLPRDEFYRFALASDALKTLIDNYIAAGRPLRLAPSIDRIDPEKGYILGNMQFITMHANILRRRPRKKKN